MVNSDCGGPVAEEITAVARPSASPAEDAVRVAVPVVVAVNVDVAIPAFGVAGAAGLKVAETPLTEKVTGLVAVVTVVPFAS